MVTGVPAGPLAGVMPVTVSVTVKSRRRSARAVVIAIGPVVAPLGIVVMSVVSETTVKDAGLPLNVTALVPARYVRMTLTVAWPATPLEGAKAVTVGGAEKLIRRTDFKLAGEVVQAPVLADLQVDGMSMPRLEDRSSPVGRRLRRGRTR
jgi:hypothetical protein